MTRYARAKGSKGWHGRQVHQPTPWHLLKRRWSVKNEIDNHGNCEISKPTNYDVPLTVSDKPSQWFKFPENRESRGNSMLSSSSSRKESINKINAKLTEVECFQNSVKERSDQRGKSSIVNKKPIYSKTTFDAKDLKVASLTMYKRKTRDSEEERKVLRRKEKALKREKKKVCFCCRKWGHQLADCPEFESTDSSDVSPPAGGLCYHCGSTEHSIHQCSKSGINSMKFARCFVCGEDGHLARQCRDNPNGKYPKGGACRVCGAASHLSSECPKGQKKVDRMIVLSCLDGPVDGLPEDNVKKCPQNVCAKKIVRF